MGRGVKLPTHGCIGRAHKDVSTATLWSGPYFSLKCSISFECLLKFQTKKNLLIKAGFFKDGRRERIRTSDPLVPNQLRYQAALLADGGAYYCAAKKASIPFT